MHVHRAAPVLVPEAKAAVTATNAVSMSALAPQQAAQPAMVSGPDIAEAVALATTLPVEMQAVPVEQQQTESQSAMVLSTAAETTQATNAFAAATLAVRPKPAPMPELVADPPGVTVDKTLGNNAQISTAAMSTAAMGGRDSVSGLTAVTATGEAGSAVSSVAASAGLLVTSEATVDKTVVSTSTDMVAASYNDQLKQSTSRNTDAVNSGSSETDHTDERATVFAGTSHHALPASTAGLPLLCADGGVQKAVIPDAALEHMHAALRTV